MPKLAIACESCGRRLASPSDVICTNCGFDTRKGKRIETRLHRLKDRGLERKAARRASKTLIRYAPWIFLLLQLVVAGGFLYVAYTDETVRLAFVRFVVMHIILAGVAAMLWVIYEDGLIALFYPTVLWLLALGDDANPWVESLMFGAAASLVALMALPFLIG